MTRSFVVKAKIQRILRLKRMTNFDQPTLEVVPFEFGDWMSALSCEGSRTGTKDGGDSRKMRA